MTDKKYNVAIVGATGAVGRAMLEILQSRKFPIDQCYCLASERSAGEYIEFANRTIQVQLASQFDFRQADLALFSAGSETSATLAPQAAAAGCIVIDNSSHFRYEKDIPLVVPEANAEDLANYHVRNIIANPNCSTIQMVVALKPIHDVAIIKRIDVATYQSVSGAGQTGIRELLRECTDLLSGRSSTPSVFPKQIAFNAVPHIDVFQENGYTREEMKMVWETQKIMHDDSIAVNPTAVRVPIFYGHSEAIHIQMQKPLSKEAAKQLLENAPGVKVIDDSDASEADDYLRTYPTAVGQGAGDDFVYVGRIRNDLTTQTGLNLWVVADNVRKGAALNAVQIAECLIQKYL